MKINKNLLKNLGISLGIAAILIIIDQLTKILAVKYLDLYKDIHIIKGFIDFKLVYNTGFAFGLGDGFQWIWAIFSIVGCIIIGYFMFKTEYNKQNIVLIICLILLFAGTFGNMIDRLFNKEGVIDFISPAFIDFAVFNVADSYITVGGILLCVYILFIYKDDKAKKNTNDDELVDGSNDTCEQVVLNVSETNEDNNAEEQVEEGEKSDD